MRRGFDSATKENEKANKLLALNSWWDEGYRITFQSLCKQINFFATRSQVAPKDAPTQSSLSNTARKR